MIGNPAEVVLVRMCADGAKPAAERFLYPNALVGFYRIGREEGLRVFGRGMSANVVRSVLMSKLPPPLKTDVTGLLTLCRRRPDSTVGLKSLLMYWVNES